MTVEQRVEASPSLLSSRSHRGGRPRHDVAARLGTHILDVASEQFARYGIAGVSMDMIAAAANVSKRTLYARFGSKNGLLRAVIEREAARNFEPIAAAIPPDASMGQKILRLARALLDRSLEPHAIGLELLLREVALHEPESDRSQPSVGASLAIDAIQGILSEAPPTGHDAETLEFLAAFLFDVLVAMPRTRILDRRQLPDTPSAKDDYFRRTVELIAPVAPFLVVEFGPCRPEKGRERQ